MSTSATASSAARGRRSEHKRYGQRRSASPRSIRLLGGGVRWPPGGGEERARPGCGGGGAGQQVGERPNASASGAARGRPSKRQRYGELRSSSAPFNRLRGGGVGGLPGGGVGGFPGQGCLSPGILHRAIVSYSQNREQSTRSVEK